MGEVLSVKTLSAPWLLRLNWDELLTLLVCVSLDIVEYLIPIMMIPLAGDFIDLAGVVFCAFYFGWIGFAALLELLPGLDVVPIFTCTWLIWYVMKRRNARIMLEDELERWK